MMQSSADSGGTWSKPKAGLLQDCSPEFMHGLRRSHLQIWSVGPAKGSAC